MIYINIDGLKKYKLDLIRFDHILKTEMDRMVFQWTNNLTAELKLASPIFTGELKTGIVARKKKDGWNIYAPTFIAPLEEGTRGHGIPKTSNFDAWVNKKAYYKVHGWNTAYIMRRAIRKYGTSPHPFTMDVINKWLNELPYAINRHVSLSIKSAFR